MSAGGPTEGPVVIAGGGTAGHILPGLSIAEALVARGVPRERLMWVGSERGQEAALVGPSGIALTVLGGRGIQRKVSPRAALDNLRAVAGLVGALVAALALVRRTRPAVVLCLGGYASVAASLAAIVWRVPVVLAEQNAVPGAANRLFGRFAAAAVVPFDGTDLPRPTVTGNPVRDIVLARRAATVDAVGEGRAAARAALGLPADRFVIAAFAGSLGSRRINEAVAGLAERWASRDDVAVHHVVGRRDFATFARPTVGDPGIHYRAVEYEERMDLVLAAADVAVCRSGGTTVAELAVVGVPSLLVPLPIAPGDHQRHNAMALVTRGAAVLVPDDECTAERLDAELAPLSTDPERCRDMARRAWQLGRPDAAAAVADLVLVNARAGAGGRHG